MQLKLSHIGEHSQRLFHGRGRVYPGLEHVTVDYFSPALLITFYKDEGQEKECAVIECVKQCLQSACENEKPLLVQQRWQQRPRFDWVSGECEDLCARRGELTFNLSLNHQNIGYFLDIEPARFWLEEQCKNKSVLNLFSYTCIFSAVAMAAGASSVVNMDLSSPSLAMGRDNHRRNGLSLDNVKFYANDIFKSWSRLKRNGPYDIVVIDPPSYQKGSFIAQKDYIKVLRRMRSLLTDGGYVLACLNAPEICADEFNDWLTEGLQGFTFIRQLPSNTDFPDADPQRALKLFVYQQDSQIP